MSLTIQAFRFAAEPFFFSHAAEKNSPELFAKVNHFFIIVCSFILLAVTINMDILKYLFGGQAYYEGLAVVPILLLGYLFLGVYYNFSIWFKLTDRTYYGTIITSVGRCHHRAQFYSDSDCGYMGSSWASLICYFLMAASCYLLGQHYYPVPYKNVQSAAYILLACFFIWVAEAAPLSNPLSAFGLHWLLMTIFLLIVYLLEKSKNRLVEGNSR